jgi:hypothetical protein
MTGTKILKYFFIFVELKKIEDKIFVKALKKIKIMGNIMNSVIIKIADEELKNVDNKKKKWSELMNKIKIKTIMIIKKLQLIA